jgi:myo-inositol-1(or 4)-monophosphatase
MTNVTTYFDVAREAALEAGQLLLKGAETDFEIYKKGVTNLVTEVDLEAEKAILERIHRHFPGHEILSEEQGLVKGAAEYRWIVDPLDGTVNYSHRYPLFCVSIALEVKGSVSLGIVYNPVSQEMFTAQRGQGAFLNDRPIRVSSCDALIDSLLCTGFSYEREKVRNNLAYFDKAAMTAQATRRDGSAALDLCFLACGRFDGFWELTLHPWDVAAAELILTEAGGRLTNLRGEPCSHYEPAIIGSNGRIHGAIVEMLAEVG